MKKILIVIDMQVDFVDGSLGTKEAIAILPNVKKKIESFDGEVIFTRDTHYENYLETQEGRNLPVVHCVKDTNGWQIHPELSDLVGTYIYDKVTFGGKDLPALISNIADGEDFSITLIGLCTDICVISNAMLLKAFYPEVSISVDANCCAGVTIESHNNAIEAMKMCQIEIV